MKQVIAALLLGLISLPAFADMWILSGSTVSGSSFVCTYSSPDGRFQTLEKIIEDYLADPDHYRDVLIVRTIHQPVEHSDDAPRWPTMRRFANAIDNEV